MLRDGQTGDWLGSFLGHKGAVWDAKLSAKADRAVTGSADFTARLFDDEGNCLLSRFSHPLFNIN